MKGIAPRIVFRTLSGLSRGRLEVRLPDGSSQCFGRAWEPGLSCTVTVHDWAFFRRLLLDGETGAGASYIAGEWSCDDLVALVRIAIANQGALERIAPLSWLGGLVGRARHRARRNTVDNARRNIREHYDLGNEFFAVFLDDTLTYSCALFDEPGQSLEAAQLNKYRAMAERAQIAAGDHVLEIGCGWGGFAEFAAREYGCRVTGVTISQAQADYARARLARARLQDRVSIELVDYREMEGRFDKIVSIEMLEAVGHENLPTFFRRLDELLGPGGLAALQVITIPDQRYARYRRRPDYIQRFIFPGSHLPSLGALTAAMRRASSLVVRDSTDIAPHYAETLRRWRLRLLDGSDDIRSLGFDDAFLRRWEYYLAYCEGGFDSRYIQDLQLTLGRAPTLHSGLRRPRSMVEARARAGGLSARRRSRPCGELDEGEGWR